jgi:hypothetical protein
MAIISLSALGFLLGLAFGRFGVALTAGLQAAVLIAAFVITFGALPLIVADNPQFGLVFALTIAVPFAAALGGLWLRARRAARDPDVHAYDASSDD